MNIHHQASCPVQQLYRLTALLGASSLTNHLENAVVNDLDFGQEVLRDVEVGEEGGGRREVEGLGLVYLMLLYIALYHLMINKQLTNICTHMN